MKASDQQIGGDHYRGFFIQPAIFSIRNKLNFVQGNVVKYICRYNLKGTPLQDLLKARHYIDLLIEEEIANAPSSPNDQKAETDQPDVSEVEGRRAYIRSRSGRV